MNAYDHVYGHRPSDMSLWRFSEFEKHTQLGGEIIRHYRAVVRLHTRHTNSVSCAHTHAGGTGSFAGDG